MCDAFHYEWECRGLYDSRVVRETCTQCRGEDDVFTSGAAHANVKAAWLFVRWVLLRMLANPTSLILAVPSRVSNTLGLFRSCTRHAPTYVPSIRHALGRAFASQMHHGGCPAARERQDRGSHKVDDSVPVKEVQTTCNLDGDALPSAAIHACQHV